MFYSLRKDVLFRNFNKFGYLTDLSEFGYPRLDNGRKYNGETYVSQSGAMMLAKLTRKPRHIDEVCLDLMTVFCDVSYEKLREDVISFFQKLEIQGYLVCSTSQNGCVGDANINQKDESLVKYNCCEQYPLHESHILKSMHLEITSVCNEHCLHCFIPNAYRNRIMDSDLAFRVVEEGRALNMVNVTITGGEPLANSNILKLIKRCRELDLSVNVLTNLTLLSDAHLEEFCQTPLLSVQTSIYSMNPSVHDSITQTKGSLEKTVNGALQIKSADIPLQISCPITKLNKDSFQDVYKWGQEHDLAVVMQPVIFATFDRKRNNLEYRLSLEEYNETIEKMLPLGYAELYLETATKKANLRAEDPICSVCRNSFCVSVDGIAYPCDGWQTYQLGDLKCQSVESVWLHSARTQKLRNVCWSRFTKCVSCPNKGYCTVCMMCNSNENQDGSMYRISNFQCEASAALHQKIDNYVARKGK